MNNRFDQLLAIRVFNRVVEAGTFTRAADSLQMPKATVTKLVQGLESHLRVKLLQRTTRRVTVTADGAAYHERMRRLVAELEEIDGSLRRSQAAPRGRLRIDLGGSLGSLFLIPALPEFQARYPEIQLEIGVTDRPVDVVADNIDCVIRAGALFDQSLIARKVADLHWVTCATPAYFERRRKPSHPHELASGHGVVNFFSPRTGRAVPLRFAKGGEIIEMEAPPSIIAVNESNAHLAAGLSGLGLIQTFRFMAGPHLARGALVEVLADWKGQPRPLYVAWAPQRHLSNKLRVFVDWAVEVFGRLGE